MYENKLVQSNAANVCHSQVFQIKMIAVSKFQNAHTNSSIVNHFMFNQICHIKVKIKLLYLGILKFPKTIPICH